MAGVRRGPAGRRRCRRRCGGERRPGPGSGPTSRTGRRGRFRAADGPGPARTPGWRTYLALQATLLSLTDRGLTDRGLRDQVGAALAKAGQDHLARVARAWKLMADLLGFRLRADCGVTFETLATLLDATNPTRSSPGTPAAPRPCAGRSPRQAGTRGRRAKPNGPRIPRQVEAAWPARRGAEAPAAEPGYLLC